MAEQPGLRGTARQRPSHGSKERVAELKENIDDEVRLNVRMKKSEYRAFRRQAFEEDTTVSEIVRGLIGSYLKKTG